MLGLVVEGPADQAGPGDGNGLLESNGPLLLGVFVGLVPFVPYPGPLLRLRRVGVPLGSSRPLYLPYLGAQVRKGLGPMYPGSVLFVLQFSKSYFLGPCIGVPVL